MADIHAGNGEIIRAEPIAGGVLLPYNALTNADGTVIAPAIEATQQSILAKLNAGLATTTGALETGNLATLTSRTPALGLTVSASSSPVVIASDQVVQTNMPDQFITSAAGFGGTQTVGNNVLLATSGTAGIDALGYRWVSIQANCSTGTYTAGTFVFEGSNDNARWMGMTLQISNSDLSPGLISISTIQLATNATVGFFGPLPYRYFRVRTTVAVTGTNTGVQFVTALRAFAPPPTNQQVAVGGSVSIGGGTVTVSSIGAGANSIGGVTQKVVATAGGSTVAKIEAAATTNATSVKATAGNLFQWQLTNNAAYAVWMKFYNKTSVPVVGTDTTLFKVQIPASSVVTMPHGTGVPFTAGIAYAITKALADTDTTVVAAGDVVGHFLYA